jgi:bla regulator protein BlaR1
MRATVSFLILVFLTAGGGHAQTFDVASVKPSQAGSAGGEGSTRESISYDPGSLTMRNVTLKSCIQWAYSVAGYQVSGPAWIGSRRYDIQAKAGSPATREQLRLMLRALLISRFHLALHRETRDLPVYDLETGKGGAKLRPAQSEGESEMQPGDGQLVYRRYSMAEFAEKLPGIPFRVDRAVVDKTGLPGTYDFQLKIAGDAAAMKSSFEHSDGPLVFDILQQIGLKLQPRKGPVPMLAIDSADQDPEEN